MASRTFVVTRTDARRTVADFLHRNLGLKWTEARQRVKDGGVLIDDKPCTDSTFRLQRGQRLTTEVDETATKKPAAKAKPPRRKPDDRTIPKAKNPHGIEIRFVDEHVLVVEKPSGLTTMRHTHEAAEFGERGRKFLPKTLEDLLPGLLPKIRGRAARVIAVHRLDKETSGLVVFARTPEAARHLGKQFREHTSERKYLALVRGQARDGVIESYLVRDRGDGRRGSGPQDQGQRAVTHVRVVEQLGDFALIECQLETGRTHQVRIHLGEAGTPLCGERIYDRPLKGRPHADTSGAERIALHAASLGFDHPTTGKRMQWTSPLPVDLQQVVDQLRRASR